MKTTAQKVRRFLQYNKPEPAQIILNLEKSFMHVFVYQHIWHSNY
jgi:hypothetical protein